MTTQQPEPPDAVGLYLDLIAEQPGRGPCPDCHSIRVVHRTDDPMEFVCEVQHDASCPAYRGVTTTELRP